ncbi:MAG: hypothetical protein FWC67_01540 [Defluviitaleaceae bacterium]|nr:hypothetical protein [Defluviitaleaceae bacterium]
MNIGINNKRDDRRLFASKKNRKQVLRSGTSVYNTNERKNTPEAIPMVSDYKNDLQDVENRLDSKITEALINMEKTLDRMDRSLEKVSDKMDKTLKWIIGFCLTTIMGITAIAVTLLISLS